MIPERMEKAFNEQINAETYSAYLYWSMAAYLQTLDFPGMAHYMECQAKEELRHAAMMYKYVLERGGKVKMSAISAPPSEWDTPLHVFKSVLAHEEKVTGMINAMVDTAMELRDHASHQYLMWFVSEQVEEESNANANLSRLKKNGDNKQAMLVMDDSLGQRASLYDILPVPQD
ncbi:MAG: ferritin [Candidatus Methanomethylophilaceae archaeon]|nr:ferritin [Candidatus Methanomethylophilaceae archaeon]